MSEWLTGGLSKMAEAASAAEGMLNSFDKAAGNAIDDVKEKGIAEVMTPIAGKFGIGKKGRRRGKSGLGGGSNNGDGYDDDDYDDDDYDDDGDDDDGWEEDDDDNDGNGANGKPAVTSKELFNFLNDTSAQVNDGANGAAGGSGAGAGAANAGAGAGAVSSNSDGTSTTTTAGANNSGAGSAPPSSSSPASSSSASSTSASNAPSHSTPGGNTSTTASATTLPAPPTAGGGSGRASPSTEGDVPSDPEELRRRFLQLTENNALLNREVTALNDEVTSFAARMGSNRATLEDTRKALTTAERKLKRLQAAKRASDSSKHDAERKLERVEKQATDLENKLVQCDGEIAELQKSKALLNRDKATAAAEHEEKYAALQQELAGAAQSSLAAKGSLAASSEETDKKAAEIKAELETTIAALGAARTEATTSKSSAAAGVAEVAQAKSDLTAMQEAFAEYKTRATKVLQTKEKMIADMRDGGGGGGGGGGVGGSGGGGGGGGAANAELIEATRERESMREELLEARRETEQLRQDLTATEEQQQEDAEMVESQMKDMEALVDNERRAHTETKTRHDEELKDRSRTTDSLKKQRLASENEVALKQAELERVRTQLHKQAVAAGGPSIDTKMRALTDNVLQKQNKIESLSSANTALTVQLEAEKKRAEDTRITIPMNSMAGVAGGPKGLGAGPNGNDDDVNWLTDGTNPNRMRPLRSMMGHGGLNEIPSIANGAQFLDMFSITMGVFLRKNPAARLMVLGYMALLHVWTLVVMFHYSPEIHDVHDPHAELIVDPHDVNMMVFRESD